MNEKIIELSHQHLLRILAIRQQTQRKHHQLLPDIFLEVNDERSEHRLVRSFLPQWKPFQRRTHFAIGCESGEDLCGYLLYLTYPNSDPGTQSIKRASLISDIGVHEQYRRQGIATQLLYELSKRARRDKSDVIYANVWTGNKASENLFQKLRFEPHMKYFGLMIRD